MWWLDITPYFLSYSKRHGSQPELAGLREVMERLGAAAYFNGHSHNLKHVVSRAVKAV